MRQRAKPQSPACMLPPCEFNSTIRLHQFLILIPNTALHHLFPTHWLKIGCTYKPSIYLNKYGLTAAVSGGRLNWRNQPVNKIKRAAGVTNRPRGRGETKANKQETDWCTCMNNTRHQLICPAATYPWQRSLLGSWHDNKGRREAAGKSSERGERWRQTRRAEKQGDESLRPNGSISSPGYVLLKKTDRPLLRLRH